MREPTACSHSDWGTTRLETVLFRTQAFLQQPKKDGAPCHARELRHAVVWGTDWASVIDVVRGHGIVIIIIIISYGIDVVRGPVSMIMDHAVSATSGFSKTDGAQKNPGWWAGVWKAGQDVVLAQHSKPLGCPVDRRAERHGISSMRCIRAHDTSQRPVDALEATRSAG